MQASQSFESMSLIWACLKIAIRATMRTTTLKHASGSAHWIFIIINIYISNTSRYISVLTHIFSEQEERMNVCIHKSGDGKRRTHQIGVGV
jgi:hypothetical protein